MTMTHDDIADAVADLRTECSLPVDAARRGPVPLDRFFQISNRSVSHVALPALSLRAVIEHLVAERFVSGPQVVDDLPNQSERLDGLLFWVGSDGLAFVNADDILPRRRFTAAHELGHAVLHRDRMGRFRADEKIAEGADQPDDQMEREANRFAVELLMPESVIRARAVELKKEHGCCPRGVLEYRLAAELLVSQQAMRYRLNGLEVGDE
jgi:Zn-dependent peptidase ImmA (M78 family)